ncbi:MAG: right-handed parallel beta-helix repeat-containing protein, partial [Thermoplasmata archaeon]|nr:right-handed parallel beta-helix repeat-containing protein [Thermoplasmata archaeon]
MRPIHTKTLTALLLLTAGLALLALAIGTTAAETITVDDDGPANYSKIQDAINNATEGDTILVKEGTYHENVIVNKTVSLIGNGSANTTIDGGGKGDIVKITADWVNVSGFRVINGSAGIKMESNHNKVFENNCSSNNNYGIYLYEFSNNNTLINNTCSNNDFGIYLYKSNYNTLSNNTCSNNHDHGIWIQSYSDNNTLTNNTCNSNSLIGISVEDSNNTTITNNTCSSNNRYGIYIRDSHNNTISNNNCSSNLLSSISLRHSDNNTLTNNTCFSNDGSGIFIGGSNNTLTNNTCFLNEG